MWIYLGSSCIIKCVSLNHFDGMQFKLIYLFINDNVEKIKQLGNKTLLFKADLQRDFRNFKRESDLWGLSCHLKIYVAVT